MRRIYAIEASDAGQADDTVRLDHDQRNRRRMVYMTEAGRPILLDMHRPVHLRGGDLLRLEDGSLVLVEAIAEPLIEIHAHSTSELVRIAWHLGNRHLPTQLLPAAKDHEHARDHGGTLRIRHDHVIAAMVEGLGGHCTAVLAPFDPEGGAYADGSGHGAGHGHHGHDHGNEQDHSHSHGHDHSHRHAHDHERSHDHAHG